MGVAVVRSNNSIGKSLFRMINLRRVELPSHEPLYRKYGIFGVRDRLPLGNLPDKPFPFLCNSDNRRRCPGPFLVRDYDRLTALHNGYHRISSAEIYTNCFSHLMIPPLYCNYSLFAYPHPFHRSLPYSLTRRLKTPAGLCPSAYIPS